MSCLLRDGEKEDYWGGRGTLRDDTKNGCVADYCGVDAIRFNVWTENFCFVFTVAVPFSNLSGILWTVSLVFKLCS